MTIGTPDITGVTQAPAEGLPEMNRRSLLRGIPAAGAVALAASLPAIVETASVVDTLPVMSPMDQARWHVAEARRLLEQATDRIWDYKFDERDGIALLIERDRPTAVWRRAYSRDGSKEFQFCTHEAYFRPRAEDLMS